MLMVNPILRPLRSRPFQIASISAATLLLYSSFSTSTLHAASMSSSAAASQTWPVTPYTPRHQSWPYTPRDFERQDSTSDDDFYSAPRFVTHIDDAAIASLRKYYDAVLPRRGRILDFCSSWVSHYPKEVGQAAKNGELRIVGMGMNQRELAANEILNAGRILQDLNEQPKVPVTVCEEGKGNEGLLDASTCVVSIDYLIHPAEVLSSLRERTKEGGMVHLIISNRCFPTKAVGRWLRIDEDERLDMVGDYLHFAGWKQIEIVDLKKGPGADEQAQEQQGGLSSFMRFMGMGGSDPLWAVRATKGQ
ncbi:hypothetical protein H2203_007707 [Taxawa tesnikishii (nom. ined.)]|nr:hypothetical protein H2203_007707 [Dothideales sp. JES 119]